jgi:hypothetical protein
MAAHIPRDFYRNAAIAAYLTASKYDVDENYTSEVNDWYGDTERRVAARRHRAAARRASNSAGPLPRAA